MYVKNFEEILKQGWVQNLKGENTRIQNKNLSVKCCKLTRKRNSLKEEINKQKRTIKDLKIQCAQANEKALEKAILNLSFNEQVAVRACFQASKCKGLQRMRYTSQWIYECLLFCIKSKKTYEHLQKKRILILPSISTLTKRLNKSVSCMDSKQVFFM